MPRDYYKTTCSQCGAETWWDDRCGRNPLCTECWDKKHDSQYLRYDQGKHNEWQRAYRLRKKQAAESQP